VLTLYDGRNISAAINPKLLQHVVFPLDRPTQSDLNQFLRSVPRTRTAGSQLWTLSIANSGSQTVTLGNWTLRLDGQPVTDVTGVVTENGVPIPGVTVSVNGVPFSLTSAPTDAQGRFILSRVPLLPLNFSGHRIGYLPFDSANPGLGPNYTRPFIGQGGLTFSDLENSLIDRFNPLAGAPPGTAGVPGFSAGTTNQPFELRMRAELNGSPRIVAGPHWVMAGGSVDFVALNIAGPVSWDFGDGQVQTNSSSTSHAYLTAGQYRARLFSSTNQETAQAEVEIVVMAAPGRAPLRPSDLGGEPTGLPAQTAAVPYGAFAFQPLFTCAGVIPAHKVGLDPATGADRYLSDVTPQSTFTEGETNAWGAAYVAMTSVQQAYSASMDIDLAPHVTPAQASRPFASDGFVPLPSPGFDPAINSNNQGFREEDFNYAHLAPLWQNTRAADGSSEYHQDPQNGLILWGNTLLTPNVNYSAQTQEARDGTDFSWALDDTVFHPHDGTTTLPEQSPPQIVTHVRMVCSMGGSIVNAPVSATSVKVAKMRRGEPDNPLDLELETAPSPVARNLQYQLSTGVLPTP
jgi:PKD repeat protein